MDLTPLPTTSGSVPLGAGQRALLYVASTWTRMLLNPSATGTTFGHNEQSTPHPLTSGADTEIMLAPKDEVHVQAGAQAAATFRYTVSTDVTGLLYEWLHEQAAKAARAKAPVL